MKNGEIVVVWDDLHVQLVRGSGRESGDVMRYLKIIALGGSASETCTIGAWARGGPLILDVLVQCIGIESVCRRDGE